MPFRVESGKTYDDGPVSNSTHHCTKKTWSHCRGSWLSWCKKTVSATRLNFHIWCLKSNWLKIDSWTVTWSVVGDAWYELQVRGPHTGCRAVTQLPQEVMIVLQFPCRGNKYSFTHTTAHMPKNGDTLWCQDIHSSTLKTEQICFPQIIYNTLYRLTHMHSTQT